MENTAEEKKNIQLTADEIHTLETMKKFPLLDKASQDRLRAKVNGLRESSPAFAKAFEVGLTSALGMHQKPKVESVFGSVRDVITHPISALKGKIGQKMLEKRNKAPGILTYPNPILKKVAEPWDFERGEKKDLIEIVRLLGAELREVGYGEKLGMAAPQIGISKRVFICQGAVCVNPEFTPPSHDRKEEVIEGCYSVLNDTYKVMRSTYGWATWYSVDGIKRIYKLKGIDAIVFQHELDHLDGKCCIDVGVRVKKPAVK